MKELIKNIANNVVKDLLINVFKNILILGLVSIGIFSFLLPFVPPWSYPGMDKMVIEISVWFSIGLLSIFIAKKIYNKNAAVGIKILLPIYAIYLIRGIYILKDGWYCKDDRLISIIIFLLVNLLFLYFIRNAGIKSRNNPKSA